MREPSSRKPPASSTTLGRRRATAKTVRVTKKVGAPLPTLQQPLLLEPPCAEAEARDETALARSDLLDEVLADDSDEDARGARPCVVTTPPVGFFIAGSSVEGMNGVYVQQSPPIDVPGSSSS